MSPEGDIQIQEQLPCQDSGTHIIKELVQTESQFALELPEWHKILSKSEQNFMDSQQKI